VVWKFWLVAGKSIAEGQPMTQASKRIWDRIADRLKELGRSPKREENVPQWLLDEVLNAKDPQLTELVGKLMSQGLDELEPAERDALYRAIVGERPKP
jgi:hypothetical protein